MKTVSKSDARKRPVNLTLNEDLVRQAREITGNLSGGVETLLTGYVDTERRRHDAKARSLRAAVTTWNDFNVRSESVGPVWLC